MSFVWFYEKLAKTMKNDLILCFFNAINIVFAYYDLIVCHYLWNSNNRNEIAAEEEVKINDNNNNKH